MSLRHRPFGKPVQSTTLRCQSLTRSSTLCYSGPRTRSHANPRQRFPSVRRAFTHDQEQKKQTVIVTVFFTCEYVYCVLVLQDGAATEVKWVRVAVCESDGGCHIHRNTRESACCKCAASFECTFRLVFPRRTLQTISRAVSSTRGCRGLLFRRGFSAELGSIVLLRGKVAKRVLCADENARRLHGIQCLNSRLHRNGNFGRQVFFFSFFYLPGPAHAEALSEF